MGGFKDKLKVIPADMGKVTQYLTLGTAFLYAVSDRKNESFETIARLCAMASLTSGVLWLGFGQSSVKNNSRKDIYYLDEITGEVKICSPGQTAYNIDGVKVGDKVYKISDGISIEVTPQNEVQFTSFFSKCFSILSSRDFLLTTPDEYFKPLFEV